MPAETMKCPECGEIDYILDEMQEGDFITCKCGLIMEIASKEPLRLDMMDHRTTKCEACGDTVFIPPEGMEVGDLFKCKCGLIMTMTSKKPLKFRKDG